MEALHRQVREMLEQGGIEDSRLEASLLMEHFCGASRAVLLAHGDRPVRLEQQEALLQAVRKRLQHYPLQYLLGEWEFMGLPFVLNEDTLIPRADTEVLAEAAIAHARERSLQVADLCCGTGCIGISVAYYCKNTQVMLCDISPRAVVATQENARRNGVQDRCEILVHDVRTPLPGEICYDMILSNPPYIPRGDLAGLQPEVQHEPRRALDGGEDGLDFYRDLLRLHTSRLRPGGLFAVECGIGQWQDIEMLMKDAGLHGVHTLQDGAGIGRAVMGTRDV